MEPKGSGKAEDVVRTNKMLAAPEENIGSNLEIWSQWAHLHETLTVHSS